MLISLLMTCRVRKRGHAAKTYREPRHRDGRDGEHGARPLNRRPMRVVARVARATVLDGAVVVGHEHLKNTRQVLLVQNQHPIEVF